MKKLFVFALLFIFSCGGKEISDNKYNYYLYEFYRDHYLIDKSKMTLRDTLLYGVFPGRIISIDTFKARWFDTVCETPQFPAHAEYVYAKRDGVILNKD